MSVELPTKYQLNAPLNTMADALKYGESSAQEKYHSLWS